MNLPVLTAVTGARWESTLVTALEGAAGGLSVVRRCVDVADLLAAATSGQGRAVLLSADLRRLDRDALSRLQAAGVAVVGVAPPDDEGSERRLRGLGIEVVVRADAGADAVVTAVLQAVAAVGARGPAASSWADPAAGLRDLPPADDLPVDPVVEPGSGRLVAVWGPTGAPGRTTVAVSLAAELALSGRATVLADADTYGGTVATHLGLLDESPGLAAAARAAVHGRLDVPSLARHARQVAPHLRVLTGIARSERWSELRPSGLEVVWALSRSLAAVTVVDCGFCLEASEELSFDTLAPRRNGATLVTLEQADLVIAVGSADPVGMARLVRGLGDLRDAVPAARVQVVVNRVRASSVGARPDEQVRAALERFAAVDDAVLVPYDRAAADTAVATGRTLAECAPASPARQALATLASVAAAEPVVAARRRWFSRA